MLEQAYNDQLGYPLEEGILYVDNNDKYFMVEFKEDGPYLVDGFDSIALTPARAFSLTKSGHQKFLEKFKSQNNFFEKKLKGTQSIDEIIEESEREMGPQIEGAMKWNLLYKNEDGTL